MIQIEKENKLTTEIESETDWKDMSISILKSVGKGIVWVLKKTGKVLAGAFKWWWESLDNISSMNPEDFNTGKDAHLKTIKIDGKRYYKSKNGEYKKLDV